MWLDFFDLKPTGNAAEQINERNNLEARINNHFTGPDGILDTARKEAAKKTAQLIKDTTTDNPGLRKMINIEVAAREPVVSNYDSLKAFVIGMTSEQGLAWIVGTSSQGRRRNTTARRWRATVRQLAAFRAADIGMVGAFAVVDMVVVSVTVRYR